MNQLRPSNVVGLTAKQLHQQEPYVMPRGQGASLSSENHYYLLGFGGLCFLNEVAAFLPDYLTPEEMSHNQYFQLNRSFFESMSLKGKLTSRCGRRPIPIRHVFDFDIIAMVAHKTCWN